MKKIKPAKKKGTMPKSVYKKGGSVTIKGVKVKGLTSRQATTLKKHSVHHTKKHIKAMVDAMNKGATFTQSHKLAMKKVGK